MPEQDSARKFFQVLTDIGAARPLIYSTALAGVAGTASSVRKDFSCIQGAKWIFRGSRLLLSLLDRAFDLLTSFPKPIVGLVVSGFHLDGHVEVVRGLIEILLLPRACTAVIVNCRG